MLDADSLVGLASPARTASENEATDVQKDSPALAARFGGGRCPCAD